MSTFTRQTRRRFFHSSIGGFAAIGVGASVPDFLDRVAAADPSSNGRVLVVLQLTGGNDGLNTLVPYADGAYRSARPALAISPAAVLKHDAETGFHPALGGLQELMQQGQLAVIRGVGYDNPNRSHFESMDIWHTCRRKEEPRPDGWLGRYLDQHALGSSKDVPALHLGEESQPLALRGREVRVPSAKSLAEFQLRGRDRGALRELLSQSLEQQQVGDSRELLSFLHSSTSAALAASQRVAEAAEDYRSDAKYPDTPLAQKLRIVAQLIDAGLSTCVYYLQLDGFDTHAQQPVTHALLLRQWGDAVSTFVKDLSDHGHAERVCVMTFSEFGRRVAENASQGTDHGAAGPMFLCGGRLRGGLHGAEPNLEDLTNGDIRHAIDFRQVYAAILQQWLGVDPMPILGGSYEPLSLFAV